MKGPEVKLKNSSEKGLYAALLAACLFGISTPLAKKLLGEISPLFLAGFLYLGSGISLTILGLISYFSSKGRPQKEARLRGKDYLYLSGAIACGGVLGPIMLTYGLSLTYSSVACVLINSEGILTALLASLIFKEAVGRRILFATMMMFLGGVALSYDPSTMRLTFNLGALLVVGACLMWALDNNLTCILSGKNPFTIAQAKGLCAGVTSVAIAVIARDEMPRLIPVACSMIVGAFGYGMSLVLFVYALRYLGSARTGGYFGLGPFIGAIASILLLREQVTWMLIVSTIFTATGVWLLLREEHSHEHIHECISHEHSHTHDDGHHSHLHQEERAASEAHSHEHDHESHEHAHPHSPDIHHRHLH